MGKGSALLCVLAVFLSVIAVPLQGDAVDGVLDRAAKQTERYLGALSDVKCTESVKQEKLGKDNRVELTESTQYDYLVLLDTRGGELALHESRLAVKGPDRKTHLPLLLSNGFATLFLIFHPYYQPSFQFTLQGEETMGGVQTRHILFAHVKGTRSPAALSLRGREYPLELSGEAWVDQYSGAVVRIDATVDASLADIGLRSMTAEIDYSPVTLPGWSQDYRFPLVATVRVESLRQHWRNIHHFEHYMRFSVDTEEKPARKVPQP
jgi:hypothetical protein